jgi:D-serine deaminase-like pyridoxal phosphate-dependent protein
MSEQAPARGQAAAPPRLTAQRADSARLTAERADSARLTAERADSAHARLERATAGLEAPFALVDLDAFEANAADLARRAAGKPIRLASKSLRCRALQGRALALPAFRGTLAYTLPEAMWLAAHGVEDLLVAYPTADRVALRELGRRPRAAIVMVDDREQLDLIEGALEAGDGPIRVCLDIDAGWRAFGGRVRAGARRSPVRTAAQAAALAGEIAARERLTLVGIMAYEAQIAGVGDAPPGRPWRGRAIRAMQSRSGRELAERRGEIVAAVGAALELAGAPPLELVNGGGTGSLESTGAEPAVTELAAGSGLYGPTLFDAYRAFAPRPAAMFALPVVRRPGPGVVTVLGGGYLASGPGDRARLPTPHLPRGLRLDGQEGAGEVQTPLLGAPADHLALGERVYFRHAKAGELSERFSSLHLLRGETIVDEVPTYRGEGQCFL